MTPALELINLSKTYNNNVEALKSINLSVEPGAFFGLLGPNGAGKSTTIGIICCLVNKSAGTVKVFGHDLASDPFAAKSCIGLVPQEFNFNVFEKVKNILIHQGGFYGVPRAEALERSEHYLNKLGIWHKRNSIARSLSGGMKRRLMIARALIHQPKLLILDEPTAGVDIELRRLLWQFLEEINDQGTTIILTTHYLEEAEALCRDIAIIDQGEIIENAPKKQLLAKLNMETIVLDLQEPIEKLPKNNLPSFKLNLLDPQTLEVSFCRQENLNTLFKALSDSGVVVQSMRNKSNRLEELFISLVGSNNE